MVNTPPPEGAEGDPAPPGDAAGQPRNIEECPVCTEEGELIKMKCPHKLCVACVERLLRNDPAAPCPYCRKVIEDCGHYRAPDTLERRKQISKEMNQQRRDKIRLQKLRLPEGKKRVADALALRTPLGAQHFGREPSETNTIYTRQALVCQDPILIRLYLIHRWGAERAGYYNYVWMSKTEEFRYLGAQWSGIFWPHGSDTVESLAGAFFFFNNKLIQWSNTPQQLGISDGSEITHPLEPLQAPPH